MGWIRDLFTKQRVEPTRHLTVAPVSGHLTTDRDDPRLRQIDPATGMQEAYIVLSEEERAKGFVRPVRRSYIHLGPMGPVWPLRDLTPEEHERYDQFDYVKYEAYPDDPESSVTGRFWTQDQLNRAARGCGAVTTMGQALAETYARDPKFYGGTMCSACHDHFPVGEHGEFEWVDEYGGRTGIKVGT